MLAPVPHSSSYSSRTTINLYIWWTKSSFLILLQEYLGYSFFFFFWLCWVFVSVRGLSLVAASGGHSSLRCMGLSLSRPLLLRSTGSRRAGSVVVAHGPSCSVACGIFPDQGSNPCPLHWQADSQPLRHQGSPILFFSYLFHGPLWSHRVLASVCGRNEIFQTLFPKKEAALRCKARRPPSRGPGKIMAPMLWFPVWKIRWQTCSLLTPPYGILMKQGKFPEVRQSSFFMNMQEHTHHTTSRACGVCV